MSCLPLPARHMGLAQGRNGVGDDAGMGAGSNRHESLALDAYRDESLFGSQRIRFPGAAPLSGRGPGSRSEFEYEAGRGLDVRAASLQLAIGVLRNRLRRLAAARPGAAAVLRAALASERALSRSSAARSTGGQRTPSNAPRWMSMTRRAAHVMVPEASPNPEKNHGTQVHMVSPTNRR